MENSQTGSLSILISLATNDWFLYQTGVVTVVSVEDRDWTNKIDCVNY